MLKNILKFLLFASLGCAVLYYIYNTQQKSYLAECLLKGNTEDQCSLWDKLKSDFSGLNFLYVYLTIFIYLLSNIFRAKRWEMLLEPLGVDAKTANTLGATLIGYLVNLAVPRAGELARATALSRNEEIDFDKAFGTVVTDRLVDMVCLILASLTTVIFAYDIIYGYFKKNLNLDAKLSFLTQNIVLLIAIIIVAISTIFLLNKNKTKLLNTAFGKKIKQFLIGLSEGLTSITKLRNPSLFVFYSIGTWVCYFLMSYTLFKAYPPIAHLGMVTGLVVFFFGSLGVVFPSPGGMGSYQFLVMESLALYAIKPTESFLYANLMFFTIQILTTMVFGVLSFVWMQKTSNKSNL
jgi:glycosyltransferase 2 family protein